MKAWHLNSDITKNLTQSWSFTCYSQTNGQIIHSQSSIGSKSMKYIGKKRGLNTIIQTSIWNDIIISRNLVLMG